VTDIDDEKPYVSVLWRDISDSPSNVVAQLEQQHVDRANHWLYLSYNQSDIIGSVSVLGRIKRGEGFFCPLSHELHVLAFSSEHELGTAHFFSGSYEEIKLDSLAMSSSERITVILASCNLFRPHRIHDYSQYVAT